MLADLGAEVVKVESKYGDEYRHIGPFIDCHSAYFLQVNRNKKSICLDLKSDAGAALARDLAGSADVLVENFRPGVMRRLGLDYSGLAKINPKLVYASISGFGQSGPNARLPAFDLIVQAMSGIMEVTGEKNGPPTMIGESIGDMIAGLYAAWSICAALYQREKTELGQHLDIAMLDSLMTMSVSSLAQLLSSGKPPQRVGNRHPVTTPFGVYRARDGHIAIAVLGDRQFEKFAAAIGRPDLPGDPRFVEDRLRTEYETELRAIIETWSLNQPMEDAVSSLAGAGISASTIRDSADAFSSEHVLARELLARLDKPELGDIRIPTQPVHFSSQQRPASARVPALGENTHEVLKDWLELAPRTLKRLEHDDVI